VPSPGQRTVRYGGNTSCVEVRSVHDDLIILDAGTGIRPLGQRLEPEATAHVFLTHRHSDHLLGLPFFAPLFDSSRAVHLHCGNADERTTRAVIDTLLSPPLFPPMPSVLERLSVQGITDDVPVEIGGRCTVHRFSARHPGEAAVFRIDDAKGAGVAYAPDNELDYGSTDPDVIAWRRDLSLALQGVPVLLHDATYTDQELPSHRGWGHSSALEATRFAMECVAGLLVLFHHHPDRTDEQMDAIVQECRELVAYSGSSLRVIAAWEGLTLTV
jgi:phosphoribosyl 1,2-cyclic phosphodiesterase